VPPILPGFGSFVSAGVGQLREELHRALGLCNAKALKASVRLFVSDYILDQLAEVLREDLNESARYVHVARRAVLRRAKRVALPKNTRSFVPGDPKDDAVVQTAISSRADYLVTADALLLDLGKFQNVEIISVKTFAELLPAPE